MTPPSFDTFFAASAGVAGALIGLLFVAISVAQERLTAENANPAHRVRASAALTSFGNALAVALFGLVPGIGLRWPAFVVGLLGLLFVAASLLLLFRVRESHPVPPRDVRDRASPTAGPVARRSCTYVPHTAMDPGAVKSRSMLARPIADRRGRTDGLFAPLATAEVRRSLDRGGLSLLLRVNERQERQRLVRGCVGD
jgi:MFS family permease